MEIFKQHKKIILISTGIITVIALAIIFFSVSSHKQNNAKHSELTIETWETNNGTKVYYNYSPELPITDIAVIFNAGSVYAEPSIAMLATSMFDEGTANKSTQEIAYGFESNGASFSASADKEKAIVSLRSVTKSKYLKPSLSLFKEVISAPSFPEENLNRLKKQAIQNLQFMEQSPASVLSKNLSLELYKNTPYASIPMGAIKSVEKITQQELKNYYQKYFTQKNAKIIINGDINKSSAKTIAQELLSKLPVGEKQYTLPNYNFRKIHKNINIDFPSSQTHIAIATPAITMKDPKFFPLILGNTILGNKPLTSELFQKIRTDMGLAYSVGSSISAHKKTGAFLITMQTRNSEAQKALAESKKILENFINQGPTDEQLISAKKYITGSFPLSFSSNSKKTSLISTIAFYDLPLNYLETYKNKINTVTKEQIALSFQQVINPKKMVTVTVGKK